MNKVIAKFLTDKASRNSVALAALLVSTASVGSPWH